METSDFIFRPVDVQPYKSGVFPSSLGPLADLPGKWQGTGFNQIWRPHHAVSPDPTNQDRFLELNLTTETLEFEEISGPIPNRGFLQGDISMFGVTYLQKVSDVVSGGIHIEPGIWAVVPPTTNPAEGETVARLASIPHGTTILAQGTALAVNGPPVIAAASITPFAIGNPSRTFQFPESNLAIPTKFRQVSNNKITQEMVDNPNSVLVSALQNQTIINTTVLIIATTAPSPISGGGTDGTAFLQGSPTEGPNASPASMNAIFWIEKVVPEGGGEEFLQLQYTQTVLLNFNGLSWPHVSVATLRKI
jgi:hypothetical protein